MAVLFFDVANFTAISGRMPPHDVMFLLNKFLTRAGRLLVRHGGYFDKAIGDGFVAIFGVQGQQEAPLSAVAAALELLAVVDAARPMVRKLYGVEFDARIGLHYGEGLIGALGPAGDERLTVIGDIANIASRVEHSNKEAGTRLLVTEDLYREVRDDIVSPDFVRIRIPGTAERRTLYEVSQLKAAARERLENAILPAPTLPGRTWLQVLASNDLPEGAVRIFPQPRVDIAVTRQGGRVFAFNNHCPHNRLPFFGEEIPDGGPLPATPASSDFSEPCRIACRFHGSVFDLDTGSIVTWCPKLAADGTAMGVEILGNLSKNEAPLEVYRVRETSGAIWIEVD